VIKVCFVVIGLSVLASCKNNVTDADGHATRAHEGLGVNASLKFNQIQFIGSHNSYKKAIDSDLLRQIDDESVSASLDYGHPTLEDQLDLGLRKLELDIFLDPDGGRYADPAGLRLTANPTPFDRQPMLLPGMKVMHVQDLDFRSQCPRFVNCLNRLVDWSDSHPRHFPIVVTINAKDQFIDRPGFVHPLMFDRLAWNRMDSLIRTTLGDKLFTPDEFRAGKVTLTEAISAGWPELEKLRGRFIFVLDHEGEKLASYVEGHEALRGRAMFANAREGTPEAAIRIVNDPIRQFDYIQSLVRAGYIVRTRADADTVEAREGRTERRQHAFSSGAQIISTDYYQKDKRFGHGYQVVLPDGAVALCNPVVVTGKCKLSD